MTVPPDPRPNRAGRAALAELRREHPLTPGIADTRISADQAAMAAGLHREIAFAQIDPAFAAATWPWMSSGRHRAPGTRVGQADPGPG